MNSKAKRKIKSSPKAAKALLARCLYPYPIPSGIRWPEWSKTQLRKWGLLK